ncbi:hypothetical protein ATJ93_1926 [Halopiger aswanensis]|uniref:Uncharacterized protein n=1 Tax=Halopiger aswanensis TaxID=148449 RepID=A0A419WI43_9EURY|nr:hypothetical protein ATJ93_1926 [Halopiger aswanensis]
MEFILSLRGSAAVTTYLLCAGSGASPRLIHRTAKIVVGLEAVYGVRRSHSDFISEADSIADSSR